MPLEIYKRRHSSACLAEIAKNVKLPLTADELQQHAACDCAWWVRGVTDDGRSILPRSLKVYTKDAAIRAMKELNQSNAETLRRVTLDAARTAWFDELGTRLVADQTTRCSRIALTHLEECMKKHRITLMREVTVVHLSDLRKQWMTARLKRNTQRSYLGRIRTFFKFAMRMDYIANNPASKLAPLPKRVTASVARVAEDENATMPLDLEGRENYDRIIAEIVPFIKERYGKYSNARAFLRHPENLLVLLQLLYETGLRISDAIRFEPDLMQVDAQGGVYTTVQRKTGSSVTVFLPPWLVKAIHALPRLDESEKQYPFYDGLSDDCAFISSNVRRPLADYGKAINFKGSLRPHRFRDSFAINRLNEGMHLEDVSRLLGHRNIAMTERYYAPFVRSRENALRQRFLQTQPPLPPTPAEVISIDRVA